ncbi:hypothetical protein [Desulfoluna butyratoxydans]|uniref:Uncharacterized protein n=1 Tax=Desulfoluna butyratoxydans TaxID=231438 RepID=A0A4V6IM04_9BACT|nr:hypothetical protein [Desulfoluna butyratoxydans]VFQ46978.1 hypothetical protein MSL71_46600 [Desulfoluna butyratoxydans]
MSINRFMDEVISRGAEAVLPHNLEEEWLERLFIAAKNFLAMAVLEEDSDEEPFGDENSMMLLSAVTELTQAQKDYTPDEEEDQVDEGLFFENLSCYSLSILFEAIRQQSEFTFELPDTGTIFDRDRLYAIEQETPVITEILNELVLGVKPDEASDEDA